VTKRATSDSFRPGFATRRLDWEFVAERQPAICYDGQRQVVR
jgi:hypothetical protein